MPTTVIINPDVPDEYSVREVISCLRAGGIIIYPTETFYGIGALFSSESALKRLFSIKQRDRNTCGIFLARAFNPSYKGIAASFSIGYRS